MRRFETLNPVVRLACLLGAIFVPITIAVWGLTGKLLTGLEVASVIVLSAVAVAAVVMGCFFVVVALHEIGHLAMGKLVGFRFRSVEVYGAGLRATKDGVKPFFVKSRFRGGFARMDITGTERIPLRYALFILGGPLVTIGTLALSIWLFQGADPPRGAPLIAIVPKGFSLAFLLANVSLACGCLVPTFYKGMATDAMLLVRLLRNAPNKEEMVALIALGEQVHDGIRARDWQSPLLRSDAGVNGANLEEIMTRIWRYYHFADLGHFDQARQELERGLQVAMSLGKEAELHRSNLGWERVFAAAWFGNDPGRASEMMPKEVETPELVEEGKFRALAAIAIRQNQPEDARKHLDAATSALEAIQIRLGIVAPTDSAWIDDMEAEWRNLGDR